MFLKSIAIHEFRNLHGKINWEPGLNVLFGNNAQGKTNWLEAIYLLAHARSFRTNHLRETIKFDEHLGIVRGVVSSGDSLERQLQISLQGTIKQTLING